MVIFENLKIFERLSFKVILTLFICDVSNKYHHAECEEQKKKKCWVF